MTERSFSGARNVFLERNDSALGTFEMSFSY